MVCGFESKDEKRKYEGKAALLRNFIKALVGHRKFVTS